jgi:LPS export ABC transporter protein LptC
MKWQTLLGITLLLIIAITGIQYRWEPSNHPSASLASVDATMKHADIEIEHPVMEHFDEAGARAWQIEGTALQYFEESDQTLIQAPVATVQHQNKNKNTQNATTNNEVTAQDNNPWHLKANTALITNQQTHMTLTGDARVSNADIDVQSEQLLFDTTRQFATTDKAVTILSRGSKTHSVGLEADLTNKILRLPGRVKETHEANKRP